MSGANETKTEGKIMRKTVSVIAGRNWQGSTFEHELKPLTAIVGANMSGKSTRVNALRVGLLGYSPSVGNKPSLTAGFLGNPDGCTEAGVDLKLSDGSWTKHRWKIVKGKVEYTGPEAPIKLPPVLLDLQKTFLSISGPAQANMIFSKMDVEAMGFTCEGVTARLKSDVKVKEPTKESEAALRLIVDDVEALDSERLEHSWTWPLWMEKVVEGITLRKDDAESTLENMAGLIQGTAQLKAGEEMKKPFDRAELDRARTRNAEMVAAVNKFKSDWENYRGRGRMKMALANALETVPDNTEAIKVLREENGAIERELATFKEPSEDTLKGKTQERDWLAEQVTELKTRIDLKGEEIKTLEAALSADKKKKCCPRCGSKGTGWKKSLTEDAAKIDAAKAELKKMEKDHTERVAQKEKADAWFTDLETKRSSQRGGERLARENSRKIETLEAAMRSVKVKVPMGESFMEQTMNVADVRAQLSALNETAPEPTADGVPTDEEVAAQKKLVEELEQAERDHIQSEGDKLRSAEASAKHATAEAEAEVATLALKTLKAVKAEMMEKAFGGFMQRVNLFATGIMQPLTYRDGEIGYFRGAAWVGWEFLSGTEKMLASIGLAVALAQESPLRIVFVDEWLRDTATRALVLTKLAKLVCDDVIDQAVFLDTDKAGLETAGYHVIEV